MLTISWILLLLHLHALPIRDLVKRNSNDGNIQEIKESVLFETDDEDYASLLNEIALEIISVSSLESDSSLETEYVMITPNDAQTQNESNINLEEDALTETTFNIIEALNQGIQKLTARLHSINDLEHEQINLELANMRGKKAALELMI